MVPCGGSGSQDDGEILLLPSSTSFLPLLLLRSQSTERAALPPSFSAF